MTNLAVPNPPTLAPGNLVTGSVWNAQVRDPLNYLLNPPLFKAKKTAAQGMTGTNAAIGFDTVIVDTYGGWNNAVPSRYFAQVTGWYNVNSTVALNQSNGYKIAGFRVNGTTNTDGGWTLLPDSGTTWVANIATKVFLNASDYVEVMCAVSTATNTSTGAPYICTFEAEWRHQ